jgi:hypothetical protein
VSEELKACPCGESIKAAAIGSVPSTDLAALKAPKKPRSSALFVGRAHRSPASVNGFWWRYAGIAYVVLVWKCRHYRITTQRVQIEHGLLSTIKDNVELFRIDHFDLHKPLGMRLLKESMLHLRSSDQHFPTVIIQGVPDPITWDTLRECSLKEHTRRCVTTFVDAAGGRSFADRSRPLETARPRSRTPRRREATRQLRRGPGGHAVPVVADPPVPRTRRCSWRGATKNGTAGWVAVLIS